jgi:hypothetical protein
MDGKPNKNEALEALDFIINVLKEHEKDLDRLVSQLSIITESLGETGEITDKIGKIEDSITNLQGEIGNMVRNVDSPRGGETIPIRQGSPVHMKCVQWDDFKTMAAGAETVSYSFKEEGKAFQAEALKNGKIVSYTGSFPQNNQLLKVWLSKELAVTEKDVFEGVLSVD